MKTEASQMSPELIRFGELADRIDYLMSEVETLTEVDGIAEINYLLVRQEIANFELKIIKDKMVDNKRVVGYYILTDFLRERLNKKYQQIAGGEETR